MESHPACPSVSASLTELVFSGSLHVVANVRASLLFRAEGCPMCGGTRVCMSAHLSMDTSLVSTMAAVATGAKACVDVFLVLLSVL